MTAMDLVHDSIRGVHLLHWLTVAVPLATLVVVAGLLRGRAAARVLLVGVAMTFATAVLSSTAPEISQIRYGAPLPMAIEGIDPLTGATRTGPTILRACFVGNLLFWCSTSVLLGAVIQSLAIRLFRRSGSRA